MLNFFFFFFFFFISRSLLDQNDLLKVIIWNDFFRNKFGRNLEMVPYVAVIGKVREKDVFVVAGDFNGHVRKIACGFEGVHGGNGYGD